MDCLVTKLKGIVNDDSIYKLGEIRISKSYADEFTQIGQGFRISFIKDATISIVGDGYFTDMTGSQNNGKTIECTANTPVNFYVSNGDFEIALSDKYSIGYLGLSKTEEATGSYNYNKTKNIVGDLDALKYCTNMSTFDAGMVFNIKGDLKILGNIPLLNTLDISQTKISGNISVLKCPLKTLNIDRCDNITGSVESFVAAQRGAGRNTGSCTLNVGSDSTITFDGSKLDNPTNSLSWTSTQITIGEKTITA